MDFLKGIAIDNNNNVWGATYGHGIFLLEMSRQNEVRITRYKNQSDNLNSLKDEGARMADTLMYGKLKMDVTYRVGTKAYGLGDLIACTVPKIRTLPINMRVKEIQYSTTTDKYTLEEDIGTLGEPEES